MCVHLYMYAMLHVCHVNNQIYLAYLYRCKCTYGCVYVSMSVRVYVTSYQLSNTSIFRASRLSLWRLTETYSVFKSNSQCPSHVLRHLLTDKPTSSRSLRVRAHNFVLPPKDNRNFLSRALYNAICPPVGDA